MTDTKSILPLPSTVANGNALIEKKNWTLKLNSYIHVKHLLQRTLNIQWDYKFIKLYND